jgi:hypothetical protein
MENPVPLHSSTGHWTVCCVDVSCVCVYVCVCGSVWRPQRFDSITTGIIPGRTDKNICRFFGALADSFLIP